MAKYNLSKIMTRAWELKKENTENIFGECLKMAWSEAKGITVTVKSQKELLLEKLEEKIAYCNERYNFNYNLVTNDWVKYGKDRTYFAVYEISHATKHNVKIDFGYFDNIKEEYVAGVNDIEDDFDCCGRRMAA